MCNDLDISIFSCLETSQTAHHCLAFTPLFCNAFFEDIFLQKMLSLLHNKFFFQKILNFLWFCHNMLGAKAFNASYLKKCLVLTFRNYNHFCPQAPIFNGPKAVGQTKIITHSRNDFNT